MRKKYISKTYLKDVDKYTLKIYFDREDCYIGVKKIIQIENPFIINDTILIKNDYYLVEVVPKNEHYCIRMFINEQKEIISYYFDITKENGLDQYTQIPYYDDLYLDVVYNNHIEVLDKDELNEALDKNMITKEDYELANNTKNELIKSIENNTNKYLKININNYL